MYTSQTRGGIPEKAVIPIKILVDGYLKRFRPSSKRKCYASLCKFIRKSWPKLEQFSLFYEKEGGTIVIKGEDEMASCFELSESQGFQSLRIILTVPTPKGLETTARGRNFSEGPVHTRITKEWHKGFITIVNKYAYVTIISMFFLIIASQNINQKMV